MIRSLRSKLLGGITGLCLCQTAASQEVEIVMPLFSNLITESGDGLYQQLFYAAAKPIDLSYTTRIYPINRAWKYFPEHESSCLLVHYDVMESRLGKASVVPAYPFGAAKTYIFSLRGQTVIRSMDELEGKTVGGVLRNTFYYEPLTSRGIPIEYAPHQILSLRKLKAGRVDVILGILPDFMHSLGEVDYDPDQPLKTFLDQMACYNNELGRSVTERVSGALEKLRSEGVMKRVMGSQFIEFDY